jgi:prepilin-type N-terminal cleavage/methylation domain-containing protein
MNKRTRAFTLIEMLVALAITSVLVILLVNVVAAVYDADQNPIG